MIDEKMLNQEEQIRAYAEIYARNLIMYGVDVREKLETATQMSYSLNQAYLRGRQDESDRRWIPCSERLPDKAGFYVVTKRQKSGEIQVALGSYRPLFNEWSGNGNFKDVLAWCELPQPYKGE